MSQLYCLVDSVALSSARACPDRASLAAPHPPDPPEARTTSGSRSAGASRRLGAVAIKNSVYVLPRSEQAHEDFQWVLREIVAGRGEATLCEARFVEGLSDAQIEALFNAARDADYAVARPRRRARLERAARRPGKRRANGAEPARRARSSASASGSRRSQAIDFFGAPDGTPVEGLLAGVEAARCDRRREPRRAAGADRRPTSAAHLGDARGIHVDRMASAWLIRRFIDPEARFKFVPGKGLRAQARRAALRHVRGGVHPRRATSAPSRSCCALPASRSPPCGTSPRSSTTST